MKDRYINPSLVGELRKICPHSVYENVRLADVSRWRIGGYADCIVAPESVDQVAKIINLARTSRIPFITLGSTSNLLFSDEGLRVLGIHIGQRMAQVKIEGNTVWCQSGVWVPGFAHKLAQAALTGAEHICGIPGTIGGLICMNGGSQRKSISEHLVSVGAVTREGQQKVYRVEECGFAYRTSRFQESGEIVVEAQFQFSLLNSKQVRTAMLAILRERRRKFPRKEPNCGSVFKSNPVMYKDIGPPGVAIERLGFKGRRRGRALVSPLHANFIVNEGGARASDVLALIAEISHAVACVTGQHMEAEVRYITALGDILAADSPQIGLITT